MSPRVARFGLVAASLAIVGCVAALAFSPPWREAPERCLALFLAASAAWLAALACAERTRVSVLGVCALALLLRVLALCSSLELSDDVYRYLWEGELTSRGHSPYAFAPADPALHALRTELPGLAARVNHPEVPAVYPPLLQAASALSIVSARALGESAEEGGTRILRALLAVADLLVLWPLHRLARGMRRGGSALVAWGLCPLVVLEFAGSAHGDALGIVLLLAAFVALARADERSGLRPELAGAALLAGAIATKYLPLLSLPWIGQRGRALRRIALVAGFVTLAFVPFCFLQGAERGFAGGLRHYGERWESASLVFRFADRAARAFLEPAAGWTDPGRVARLVVGVAWLAWALLVFVRVRDRVRGFALLVAGFLFLSPTLHPWYLTWSLPFAALAGSWAWLWLVAAAPVLYAPLATWQAQGRWVEPAWQWPVLALPFLALLLFARRGSPWNAGRT